MINFFKKRKKLSGVIALLIAITIFYMSSLPSETFSGLPSWMDVSWKSVAYHFIIFSTLTFFSIAYFNEENSKILLTAISLIFIYSILDEFHQYFVPGRFTSYFDLLVNSVGILMGITIALKD